MLQHQAGQRVCPSGACAEAAAAHALSLRRCWGSSSSWWWLSSCSTGCGSRARPTSTGTGQGAGSRGLRHGSPGGGRRTWLPRACVRAWSSRLPTHPPLPRPRHPMQLCEAVRGVRRVPPAVARLPGLARRTPHAAGAGHYGRSLWRCPGAVLPLHRRPQGRDCSAGGPAAARRGRGSLRLQRCDARVRRLGGRGRGAAPAGHAATARNGASLRTWHQRQQQ